MSEYKLYRKNAVQPLRPYIEGETLEGIVSISETDRSLGSPKVGDMIAYNPNDVTDMWLISKEFFETNYEEICKPEN